MSNNMPVVSVVSFFLSMIYSATRLHGFSMHHYRSVNYNGLGTSRTIGKGTSFFGLCSTKKEEIHQPQQQQRGRRLEYVHSYHAGNYADVIKHSILICLMRHMQKKTSPFLYVDTHSGAGLYQLLATAANAESASKAGETQFLAEFQRGIGRILSLQQHPPALLPDPLPLLLRQINNYSDDGNDSIFYPGSPLIARQFLREQDSMLLFEKSNEQFQLLNRNLANEDPSTTTTTTTTTTPTVETFCEDGYKGLQQYAFRTKNLPRGLVLIDPPHQYGSDSDMAAALVEALAVHWRSARIALWLPASERLRSKTDRTWALIKDAAGGDRDVLALEVYGTSVSEEKKMDVGTGVVLVNPPFGVREELSEFLPRIAELMSEEGYTLRIEEL